MQQGYTGPEVCNITGISYRQLDHWTSTKLVDASIRNIKGSGYHRIYSFQDIIKIKLVNKLREAGVSLQKIRLALKNVKQILGKNINEKISTGEIEILVSNLKVLNKSLVPPFTLENESDGDVVMGG